jgi:dTDP-4-dehydrorhamnose 3,5-epimerase
VFYKVSTSYQPATEKGFRWNDPIINIKWPIDHPIVSERDQNAPLFQDIKNEIEKIK